MEKRVITMIAMATVLLALFDTGARATEFWSRERLLSQMDEPPAATLERVPIPQGEEVRLDTTYYLRRYAMAAAFLSTMQVADDTLPDFGGIKEGESQQNIVQTDNTQEAIWIWSRYTDLTGDSSYVPGIAAAWTYVMNNPSYNEEGGSGDIGYYRIYNCGWAMAAEMEYRRVFADSTYIWYSDSSAHYVVNNPLDLYATYPYDILNGMVAGWACGNLYALGGSSGDTTFHSDASAIGALVKEWAEADPDTRLGAWYWAMSGGAAFWGIMNSYFQQHPEGRRSWSQTYDGYLKTYVTFGGEQNAWNLWFALGHYTAWDSQGSLQQKKTHKGIIDLLISLDGDGDGGIGHTENTPDYNDQSWVTSYLAYMGLDKLRIPVDMVIIPDTTTVNPGDTLTFTGVAANNTDAPALIEGWTDIFLANGDPYPGNPVLGPFHFNLNGGESATLPINQQIPAGAPPGIYTYRGSVGTWPDPLTDVDDALIEVTGGGPR